MVEYASGPANITAQITGSSLSFSTPTENWYGVESFRVNASDGEFVTSSNDFLVTVTPVNDLPVILSTPRSNAMAEARYLYRVLAGDVEGDPLTFALDVAPMGADIAANGTLSWTPTRAQIGQHNLTLNVSDGVDYTLQSFVVTVGAPPNGAPLFTSTPPTTATVGEDYLYQPTGQDPEGDSLAYTLPMAPVGMAINGTSGPVTWIPTLGQVGTYPVAIQLSDGELETFQNFTIDVEITNTGSPPKFVSTAPTVGVVGETWEYKILMEPGTSALANLSLPRAPPGMSLTQTPGSAEGTAKWIPEVVGTFGVEVRVMDIVGRNASQSFEIAVSASPAPPSNLPPVITSTPPAGAIAVGDQYRYQANAIDPDIDAPLTFTLSSAPSGMEIGATGLITWTPEVRDAGRIHPVVLRVADHQGAFAEQGFNVTVKELASNGGDDSTLLGSNLPLLLVLIAAIVVIVVVVASRRRKSTPSEATAEIEGEALGSGGGAGPEQLRETKAIIDQAESDLLATSLPALVPYHPPEPVPTSPPATKPAAGGTVGQAELASGDPLEPPGEAADPRLDRVVESVMAKADSSTTLPDGVTRQVLWDALTQLPRGLPGRFAGREMDQIVDELLKSEYREVEGEVQVKLGRHWYYGDPSRLGEYLQKVGPE